MFDGRVNVMKTEEYENMYHQQVLFLFVVHHMQVLHLCVEIFSLCLVPEKRGRDTPKLSESAAGCCVISIVEVTVWNKEKGGEGVTLRGGRR